MHARLPDMTNPIILCTFSQRHASLTSTLFISLRNYDIYDYDADYAHNQLSHRLPDYSIRTIKTIQLPDLCFRLHEKVIVERSTLSSLLAFIFDVLSNTTE